VVTKKAATTIQAGRGPALGQAPCRVGPREVYERENLVLKLVFANALSDSTMAQALADMVAIDLPSVIALGRSETLALFVTPPLQIMVSRQPK